MTDPHIVAALDQALQGARWAPSKDGKPGQTITLDLDAWQRLVFAILPPKPMRRAAEEETDG